MTRDDDAVWHGVTKGLWTLLGLVILVLAGVAAVVFR